MWRNIGSRGITTTVRRLAGKVVWRYRRYDFSTLRTVGQLTASLRAKDAHGVDHVYDVHAGVRDQRFILLEKARSGKEPVILEIYPDMGSALRDLHCGVGFMQAWDGNEVQYPCIMGKSPVVELGAEGDVDPEFWAQLNQLWTDESAA